jgi:hypothetical protein
MNAEDRECLAEDRAKGKKEDFLIESQFVEEFLNRELNDKNLNSSRAITKTEHKIIIAHINYIKAVRRSRR